MNLYVESDSQQSGKLVKAYRRNWNFSRNKGSYNTHRDFFSTHWEIHVHSPNIVRMHVESPKNEMDSELNVIKLRLIIGILSRIGKIIEVIKCGDIITGTRLLSADKNKSTEIFHVLLDDKFAEESETLKVERVDDEVGDLIDEVVKRFEKEFQDQNLNSTTP